MPIDARNTQRTSSEGAHSSPAFTASDSADLGFITRGLHASTDGYIKVTFENDADNAPKELYVLRGVAYPYWVKRIWATTVGVPTATVDPVL